MADEAVQLGEVRFVKRIVLGSQSSSMMKSEEEIERAVALLNRCLNDHPRGAIIGVEKSFSLLRHGEHQIILQHTVYHVGFPRRPLWLD